MKKLIIILAILLCSSVIIYFIKTQKPETEYYAYSTIYYPYVPAANVKITNVNLTFVVEGKLYAFYTNTTGKKKIGVDFLNLVDVLIDNQITICSPSNHIISRGEKFIITNYYYAIREKNGRKYFVLRWEKR